MNPLSFRIGLFDPSPFLNKFDRITRRIFSVPALIGWLLLVAAGLLATIVNWPSLKTHATDWMPTSQAILLTWLAFPVIKALHELAHGLAVRRWGGEVHEAGLTLLLLTPVPFVNASGASSFARHHHRLVVSAAGIMLELLLAALAVLLWTQVQPGMIRDLCLVVASICGISTIAFNGNPLLRFDGYYMLSDAIHLPNLYSRSALYWRYLILRHALRLSSALPPDTASGEKGWLLAYSPMSWCYRIALSIFIISWIGSWSPTLGFLVAIWSLWTLLFQPLVNFVHSLRRRSNSPQQQRRAFSAMAAWALIVVLISGLLPLPFTTVAQGVVWAPENALVRPGSSGFIQKFPVLDGARVATGDVLVILADPDLLVHAEKLKHEIVQRETELYRLMLRDQVAAKTTQDYLEKLAADLRHAEEKIAKLEIRAGASGRLAMPHQADILGSFVAQGKPLGYIITDDASTVRVVVGQDAANLVQSDTHSISVRLAETPWKIWPAKLNATIPAASDRLPSAALSDYSGGPHVVAPGDSEHLRTREQVFAFDLSLPAAQGDRIGGRAWVRFEHEAKPIAVQIARHLQQLFLHTFSPGG